MLTMTRSRQANLRSARAADWRNWGQPIDNPVPGAVVVLEPLVPGSTGHVGFVVEAADDFVQMLGGNQRDEQGREVRCASGRFQWTKLYAFAG